VANGGGGVAHQEVEAAWKGTLAGHELGRVSAMVRSLHELEWREEKGEDGVRSMRRHASGHVLKEEKGGGVRYGGESES